MAKITRKKIKVAVIMGGRSAEHDVSMDSAKAILDNINKNKYSAIPVIITRSGIWKTKNTSNTFDTLRKIKNIDVAFIMMHGPYGEDGTVQGMFEMLDIPYTGAGVLSSSLSMNKLKTKELAQYHGIDVAKYIYFTKQDWKLDSKDVVKRIANKIGFPCVVKPNDLGSSIGISIPNRKKELAVACREALKYSDQVLVEKYIDGREIHCGVLGNDEIEALPLDEVLPANEFYDYEAKYKKGKSDHKMPADIDGRITKKIQEQAKKIYRMVLCQGFARVDFFLKGNKVYFNEINTIPGFTQTSIFPKEAAASGNSYPQLIDRIIRLALKK
jgi:D-alanine-D-alanine ligase